MRRNFRDRLLVGLLGSAALAVGCSRLTSPDWGLIPLNSAGTSGTGATDAGGEPGSGGVGASSMQGGEAGELIGGEAGAAGGGGETAGTAGSGGSGGGSGGVAGSGGKGGAGGVAGSGGSGGTGGAGGSAGMAGSAGSAGAAPCTNTPGTLDNALVLFAGPAGASGARGGRAAMDAACETERVKLGLSQTTTHAFITIAVNDFIGQWGGPNQFQDVPSNQRVVGPTGVELATSFPDLIDGQIERSLGCAKVFPASIRYWLSGNNKTCQQPIPGGPYVCGQFSSPQDTCSGWTLGSYDPITQARYGSTTSTTETWLTAETTMLNLRESCDVATDPILCLAYTP